MTTTPDSVRGVLLDTHVIVWLASEPERCGKAIDLLSDPGVDLWISAASTWELAIKMSIGRLTLPLPPADYIESRRQRFGALLVNIDHRHAGAVSALPLHHGDPFDRLLVAQAQFMDLAVATADPTFAAYDVPVVAVGHGRR